MRSDGNWLLLVRRGRGRRVRSSNGRDAYHRVAAHEAGDLARRNPMDRLRELDHEPPVPPGGRRPLDPRRDRRGPVSQLHAVDLAAGAVEVGAADLYTRARERAAGTDHYPALLGVLPDHVERLARGEAEAPALPHRE